MIESLYSIEFPFELYGSGFGESHLAGDFPEAFFRVKVPVERVDAEIEHLAFLGEEPLIQQIEGGAPVVDHGKGPSSGGGGDVSGFVAAEQSLGVEARGVEVAAAGQGLIKEQVRPLEIAGVDAAGRGELPIADFSGRGDCAREVARGVRFRGLAGEGGAGLAEVDMGVDDIGTVEERFEMRGGEGGASGKPKIETVGSLLGMVEGIEFEPEAGAVEPLLHAAELQNEAAVPIMGTREAGVNGDSGLVGVIGLLPIPNVLPGRGERDVAFRKFGVEGDGSFGVLESFGKQLGGSAAIEEEQDLADIGEGGVGEGEVGVVGDGAFKAGDGFESGGGSAGEGDLLPLLVLDERSVDGAGQGGQRGVGGGENGPNGAI